MSKADYPYPDDEFDAPPDPTAPRGVHRAPRSAWSRWWPFLAVLVLAPALAYGIVAFATRGGDLPVSPGGSDADETPSATATAPATPGGEATADESEPAGEEEPTQDPTTEAPAPDFSTNVTVYNAAGIQGLAAKGAERLGQAGFTDAVAANFSGTKPAESTVYYGSDEDATTASVVAAALGISSVQLDPAQAPSGVVVVLVSALP
ncbi:LytR C-terminal domain-containing protein [Cellulomonas palmilytica]|uniref:LytR C-terminal domain-containing protein n=1 Tax=Cellulomonas palmilytica TaxID=2608402 RepID=UPI001F2EFCED|nr:LytR C-terminal domain-containing protein [Cellulomonas palmilytica]UJP40963.1 LytR C-terminal domain-containing protein [Cellulomonas palmilytica]